MLSRNGILPTIPEYYTEMINKSVDLLKEPKQCCPFHKEDTPSFSYSIEKGVWRCFGACKCGGDVYELHRKNYRLKSREDAVKSLNAICGIASRKKLESINIYKCIDEDKVESEILYQKALCLAVTPERWLQLDYFMSKTPIELSQLKYIVEQWENQSADMM